MDQRLIDGAYRQLRDEFGHVVAPDEIDALLRQYTGDLVKTARVDMFVPLLAFRRTRAHLRANPAPSS